MLSRRIVRASPARLVALVANRSPIVQQRRAFLPDQLTGRGGLMEEKYPDSDYPQLTDAEDPEMV